jgi:hypothetical protein
LHGVDLGSLSSERQVRTVSESHIIAMSLDQAQNKEFELKSGLWNYFSLLFDNTFSLNSVVNQVIRLTINLQV